VLAKKQTTPERMLFWYTHPMLFSTLLIDLDDTVYSRDSGVWQAIRQRIDLYVAEKFHLSLNEAVRRRQDLFLRYGTTMRGLQAEYSIDEDEYLAFVHDVPLTRFLQPDPDLCCMFRRYPQRKVIFTNADVHHARRVLTVLNLEDCFEQIIDIKAMAPYCKPMPTAFQIALTTIGETDPARCVLVDDSPNNIQAARALGLFAIRVGTSEPDPNANATISRLADLPEVFPVGSSQKIRGCLFLRATPAKINTP
jgi:pyrimidine 5'-nucleotidase